MTDLSRRLAVARVSNKRYYDSIHQERYIGLPATNVTVIAGGRRFPSLAT